MRADEHLILHGLSVKRHATSQEVADLIGFDETVVLRSLEKNVENGRVADLNGKFTLLPGARMIVRGEYSRHYADIRASESFMAAYERFELINEDLKSLITAWQVRPLPSGESASNDHSDVAYDEKIVDRLSKLHDRFMPTLDQMVVKLPRMGIYAEKLETAIDKAEGGEHAWISDVTIPSYHTVWFELHEDLLCMLGKVRVE